MTEKPKWTDVSDQGYICEYGAEGTPTACYNHAKWQRTDMDWHDHTKPGFLCTKHYNMAEDKNAD